MESQILTNDVWSNKSVSTHPEALSVIHHTRPRSAGFFTDPTLATSHSYARAVLADMNCMANQVIFPKPGQDTIINFIVETTTIERLLITPTDVANTLIKKEINPAVAGQLVAISSGLKMVADWRWPAQHAIQFESEAKSDTNLYWLRDLHKHIMTPFTKFADELQQTVAYPLADCGRYRLGHLKVGMDRWMPKPTSLTSLMHLWHQTVGNFHLKVANQLHRPSNQLLQQLADAAWKAHLQLVCIHPYSDGTGMTARIVENLLRLRWGLPWKVIKKDDVMNYIHQIAEYEDGPEWQDILKAHNAKPN